MAFLLASRYEQIKKVVVSQPHIYCFQALNGLMSGNDTSSWSYKGEPFPYIKVDNDIFFEEQKVFHLDVIVLIRKVLKEQRIEKRLE